MFERTPIALALGLLARAPPALAAGTRFDDFTPGAATVTPLPVGDVQEPTAPFVLSSPHVRQKVIADRVTQLARGRTAATTCSSGSRPCPSPGPMP